MTIKEFFEGIENYYGKYKNEQKKLIIAKYLKETYEPEAIRCLFKVIIRRCEGCIYSKNPPDVATFYKLGKEVQIELNQRRNNKIIQSKEVMHELNIYKSTSGLKQSITEDEPKRTKEIEQIKLCPYCKNPVKGDFCVNCNKTI